MEPNLRQVDEASPHVELPRRDYAIETMVLVVLAAVLLGVVFLLLTSGSAAA